MTIVWLLILGIIGAVMIVVGCGDTKAKYDSKGYRIDK